MRYKLSNGTIGEKYIFFIQSRFEPRFSLAGVPALCASMSNSGALQNRDEIVAVLRGFPAGATVEQIEPGLAHPVPRRVLNFLLNSLADQNQILRDAGTSPVRFRLAPVVAAAPAPLPVRPALPVTPTVAVPVHAAEVPPVPGSGRAVTPVPTGAPAPVATGGPPVPVEFVELFGLAVAQIINGPPDRFTAELCLQAQAWRFLGTEPDRQAFIAYGKKRLAGIRYDEVKPFNVEPPQFAAWALKYQGGKNGR